ncbi:MAG: hypothetical protein ACYCOX_08210, partial [Acidobacteriaceae bacterium]
MPQCIAAKLRQHNTAGVYLTHDSQVIHLLARRTPGTYWIDGYQMAISNQTQICWHDTPLQFGPILDRDGQSILKLKTTSPCESALPGALMRNAWLQYLGVQKYVGDYRLTPEMKVVASRVDIWRSENNGNQMQAAPKQTWRNLCASASPHELRYPNEGPINVVCDTKVNSYVENVLSSLLKPSAITPDAPIAKQETPSFYVVEPFEVRHNYDFEAIVGSAAICGLQGTLCTYQHPHAHSMVHKIVYAPDGTVLIADTALAHLKNEAEFAALLSYSLAATDQQLVGRLFRAQHFMGGRWSSSGHRNGYWIWQFIWNVNEQVLRLGIRQMYLAGYDIRYAPFAWSVEQGKRIKGSVDEPNKHMPWYATYAFNAIDQLYPNVNYSKLKRGRAEYQQFLGELRQADPGAF